MNKKYNVIVIGDIIIDKYTYVTSNRDAKEASIPVWENVYSELRLAGAGNVANNLKSIGGDCIDVHLAGLVGRSFGESDLIRNCDINNDMCIGSKTMLKHRYVDAKSLRYLMRCDDITKFQIEDIKFFEACFLNYIHGRKFDAAIISDSDNGTVTERIMNSIADIELVVVNSKRKDIRIFEGSNVIKLSENDYSQHTQNLDYVIEKHFDNIVVTLGSRGARLYQKLLQQHSDTYTTNQEIFPVDYVKINDAIGCGDTHTAAMAFSLLKDNDIRSAIRFANVCARTVVQLFGTSTP